MCDISGIDALIGCVIERPDRVVSLLGQTVKNSCVWEEIDHFQFPSEFARFIAWIESQVSEKKAFKVPVKDSYAGLPQRWFQCSTPKSVWRLVYTDGPFHGYWGAVT